MEGTREDKLKNLSEKKFMLDLLKQKDRDLSEELGRYENEELSK